MLGILDKARALRRVALFHGLLLPDLIALGRIAETKQLDPGNVIFREREKGTALYVVIEGSVEIFTESPSGEKTLAEIGADGCFGEAALVDDDPHSSSARVKEASTLLQIEKDTFRKLLKEHPDLVVELLRVLSRRLAEGRGEVMDEG